MIYRVVIDSIDFLDYTDPELTLLSPRLDMEVNTAGSLEFTIPPYHKHYDKVKILVSTVEVYEDGELIWYGRPVEQVIDFYKQKKIYCEGPLSFFNDSVQIKMEFDSIRLSEYFAYLINAHNAEVLNKDRTFQVGQVTIADSNVYRKLDYQSSYDALKGTCLDTVDGYFFFRREKGKNYIDWVKNIPYSSNQELKFGINLLDYQSDFDASDFATGVLALGKDQGDDQGPLTLAGVNNGQEVLLSEAASTYGRIVKIQNWSDIKDASELLSEAQKYLSNLQFNSLVIECSAVDLHYFNPDYGIYKLGQNVHVYSVPHLIDRDYPISKISINLDSASKQITLGTIKRKTLTRIYKEDKETQDNTPTYDDTGGYDPGGTMPGNDEWEIVMPEEDGDPITAKRLPTHIVITRPPSKTVYKSGDQIDYTGIMVSIRTTDKDGNDSSWTNPPRYIDGTVPFDELSFPTTLAPVMQEGATAFQVTVSWNYKSKRYTATLDLSIEEEKKGFQPNVNAAGVEICHLEGGPYDRHFTTITSIPARACCWSWSTAKSYNYLIVSLQSDGCKVHCQDVRSPGYTSDHGATGQITIDDVTYYYGSTYGLYTSYGGHAVSHIGPLITAANIQEAVRQLVSGG